MDIFNIGCRHLCGGEVLHFLVFYSQQNSAFLGKSPTRPKKYRESVNSLVFGSLLFSSTAEIAENQNVTKVKQKYQNRNANILKNLLTNLNSDISITLFLYYRALSKFSAVGSGSESPMESVPPEKMCNSMRGSLIKKQVSLYFIYNLKTSILVSIML